MRCSLAFVVTFVATYLTGDLSDGAFSVSNPPLNGPYFTTANIASDGNCDMGVDVRIRIQTENSVTLAESPIIDTLPMNIQWAYNFTAPTGGWSVSNTRYCVVFDTANNVKVAQQFRIVNMP